MPKACAFLKGWLWLWLCLGCLPAPAETFDSDFGDAAKTFKVDNSRLSEPSFKIQYDGHKFSGVKEPAAKAAAATAPAALWKPEWTFFGVGGPALSCVRASGAAGLLAVAENIGGKGSRVAFLDLASGQPCSVAALPGRLVDLLAFSPDGAELFYCSRPQSGRPAELGVLDVAKAKEARTPTTLKFPAAALATDGRHVFVKPDPASDDKKLHAFDAKDLSSKPEQVPCDNLGGVLAVSADGAAVLVAGAAGAELVDALLLRKRGGFALPPGYVPDHVLAVPFEADAWLLSAKGRPAYLARGGKLTELTPFSGEAVGVNETAKALMVESGKNDTVLLFEYPSAKPLGEFAPSKTKPVTRRPALLLCGQPSTGKHLVFDDFGNLATYWQAGKKWRKELLFKGVK